MYTLGISSYAHESSCTLLKDGHIQYILEEERFNREKHTAAFPKNAIAQCLELEGISIEDIDHFTFYWKPGLELTGNIGHFVKHFPASLNLLKGTSGGSENGFLKRLNLMKNVGTDIMKTFGLKKIPKVHFIEHHLAHAASAFYVSPFKDAAILTIDGRGESESALMCSGSGTSIEKVLSVNVPHSLGHLYASITHYLGFRPFQDEWKVMGLSAYGKDRYRAAFRKVLYLEPNGGFKLNLKYFKFHTHGQREWLSPNFYDTFGPPRKYGDEYNQKHFDIAYALQKLVEETGVHLANTLYQRTNSKNLCMTGGVVLNCLMNKRIVEESPFENFFFQPVANDAGTSAGSALYHYHHELGGQRDYVFQTPYLGNEFSDDEVEEALIRSGVQYTRSENIASDTAAHLAEGKIIGWFQGRMEAGPRALGNRSILADPRRPDMKDRLNARVKKREFFRPFAPSVLEEKVFDFFSMPKNLLSPYMILIGDVLKDKRSVIPAVTHEDGTARVQTVSRNLNQPYWNLISEFDKLTGVPVVLNTSFNENEPIVCSPVDAVNCYLRTDFDVLAIGNFMAVKS